MASEKKMDHTRKQASMVLVVGTIGLLLMLDASNSCLLFLFLILNRAMRLA
jgi:hypothetical protein